MALQPQTNRGWGFEAFLKPMEREREEGGRVLSPILFFLLFPHQLSNFLHSNQRDGRFFDLGVLRIDF